MGLDESNRIRPSWVDATLRIWPGSPRWGGETHRNVRENLSAGSTGGQWLWPMREKGSALGCVPRPAWALRYVLPESAGAFRSGPWREGSIALTATSWNTNAAIASLPSTSFRPTRESWAYLRGASLTFTSGR